MIFGNVVVKIVILPSKDINEWERAALQDVGRDSCSRFITVPTTPEFGRSLPEHYLTNSTNKQQQWKQLNVKRPKL